MSGIPTSAPGAESQFPMGTVINVDDPASPAPNPELPGGRLWKYSWLKTRVPNPTIAGGQAAPTTPPVLAAAAGTTAFPAGTYDIAYTYVTALGETFFGGSAAVASVVLTAGQQINVSALAGLPAGVTQVKFYLTNAPQSSPVLYGLVSTQAVAANATPAFSITAQGDGLTWPPPVNQGIGVAPINNALAGNAVTTVTISDSLITADTVVEAWGVQGNGNTVAGTEASCHVNPLKPGAGSCVIQVRNLSATAWATDTWAILYKVEGGKP